MQAPNGDPKQDKLIYKALRMPESLVRRLESLRKLLGDEAKKLGTSVTFTHVVVLALKRGLDVLEKERARRRSRASKDETRES